jgi:hypothetical protein
MDMKFLRSTEGTNERGQNYKLNCSEKTGIQNLVTRREMVSTGWTEN